MPCPFPQAYMADVLGVPIYTLLKNELVPAEGEHGFDGASMVYESRAMNVLPSATVMSRAQAALRELARQPDEFCARGAVLIQLKATLMGLYLLSLRAYSWGRFVEVKDG